MPDGVRAYRAARRRPQPPPPALPPTIPPTHALPSIDPAASDRADRPIIDDLRPFTLPRFDLPNDASG